MLILPLLISGSSPTPLTFALVGDISLARGTAQAWANNWPHTLDSIEPVLKANATFGNLESPLTDRPKQTTGIDLRAPLVGIAALKAFSYLGIENNHANDAGVAGQQQNKAWLKQNGFEVVNKLPIFTMLGGYKVAWLAFFDDGITSPPLTQIKQVAQQADLVVLGVHWGEEYGLVTQRQRNLAKAFIEAGASLIVGSGPHVLQGHEVLGRSLVLYSLGNFLFDATMPNGQLGAVVRTTWVGDVKNKKLGHWQACAIPTLSRGGRLKLATAEYQQKALAALGLGACTV